MVEGRSVFKPSLIGTSVTTLHRLLTGRKINTEDDAFEVSIGHISHCALSNLVCGIKKYKA